MGPNGKKIVLLWPRLDFELIDPKDKPRPTSVFKIKRGGKYYDPEKKKWDIWGILK